MKQLKTRGCLIDVLGEEEREIFCKKSDVYFFFIF